MSSLFTTAWDPKLSPAPPTATLTATLPPTSQSKEFRDAAALFKASATHAIVKEAVDRGFDITYIDETVPVGEVCGYNPTQFPNAGSDGFCTVFYAIRRFRNDCFPDIPESHILVSDCAVHFNGVSIGTPYQTPPRWQAPDAKWAVTKTEKI